MRRPARRLPGALAGLLLVGAATAHAQLPLSVDDDRVIERSSGLWTLSVAVRLPSPPPATDVTVDWTLQGGSAVPVVDYITASGTLTFTALVDDVKYVDVQIWGDLVTEWGSVLEDEVFFIVLSNPSPNAVVAKGRGTITLIDDDRSRPGLQFLSAVTGSAPLASTEATLQWRIPGAQVPADDVIIRWDVGASCTFPTTTTGGVGGTSTGGVPPPGLVQTFTVSGLTADQPHCFSAFAMYGGTPTTGVAQVEATPFDGAAGSVAWRYATGSTNVVPPVVGADAIYSVDNEGVVHAMVRGAAGGGVWPATWNPVAVGRPTHNRSPVVPTSNGWRLFTGSDEGGLHALDGRSGIVVWSRSTSFYNELPNIGGVQAQPAGIFTAFGGGNDMLLVGTNTGAGANAFYALDPATGSNLDVYPDGSMGGVTGMAVVDYWDNRVYFLSSASSATFFALDLGPAGSPGLTLSSLPGGNPRAFGTGSPGSAVLANRRLIFGDSGGAVYGIDLVTGASYSGATGDGPVKGFLWPDRRDDRLYFATGSKVHAWSDTGSSFTPIWSLDVTTPSIVLQSPGTDFAYVGDGNGRLIQIDVTTQAQTPLLLEGPGVQIGAPSLDYTHGVVVVGSTSGTVHAVRVPY